MAAVYALPTPMSIVDCRLHVPLTLAPPCGAHRLKKAEPITALRLTGVLMQVLDPDKMGRMLRRQLWPTISGFLHTKEEADTVRALQREVGAGTLLCDEHVYRSPDWILPEAFAHPLHRLRASGLPT